MSGYADKVVSLGITIPIDLGIHRVLQSLPPRYKSFVMNYNMQGMKKSLPSFYQCLRLQKWRLGKNIKCWWSIRPPVSRRTRKASRRERRAANLLPRLKRNPELALSLTPSATIARGLSIGSATAPSIWQTKRPARQTKVYVIYMLLMCSWLVLEVAPGYLIWDQLLIYVTRFRGYGTSDN